MTRTTKTAFAFLALMTAVAAFADSPQGNTRPHNEGGDIRVLLSDRIFFGYPPSDPRNPFHWAWKAHQTANRPRFADNEPVPGGGSDDGDLPPG